MDADEDDEEAPPAGFAAGVDDALDAGEDVGVDDGVGSLILLLENISWGPYELDRVDW